MSNLPNERLLLQGGFVMIQNSNYHKSDSGILSYDRSSSGKRLRNSHSSKKDRRVHPRREQNPLKPSLFIASAAVICFTFVFFLFYSRFRLIPYPIIENLTPEDPIFSEFATSLYKLPESLGEYEARIQTDLSSLIPDYTCTEDQIVIFYKPDWQETGNLARLVYTSNRRSAFLKVSTTASPAPQQLFSENFKTTVGSTDVYFGYTQSPETLYAAWEQNHVYYCLSQKGVSHTSFSGLVESVLRS